MAGSGFGIQATELMDPQGRGSAPISPVQGPATVVPDLGGLGGLLSGLVNKKEKPWSPVINEYVKEASQIQNARLTDPKMTASRAANMLAQLTVRYQREGADYGLDYTKDIATANQQLRVGTRMDRNDEMLDKQEDANQEQLQALQKEGVLPNVANFAEFTPSEQQQLLQYTQASEHVKYTNEQLHKQWQQKSEIEQAGMRKGTWQREANDYIMQKQAADGMGMLMSSSIGIADVQLTSVMRAPGLTDEQRQQTFNNSINRMKAEGFNILKDAPQLYGTYSSYLDNLTKLGAEMLDPAKRTEAVQNEWTRLITKGKLDFANADPANLNAAVVSTVFPSSAAGTLAFNRVAMNYLQNDLVASQKGSPLDSVVVGNVQGQQLTFKSATDTVRRSMDGKSYNPTQELEDASKVFNSTVKAISTFQPGSQNSMAYAIDALASPEYGHLVKQKMFNPDESIQAAERLGDLYLPAVTTKLERTISQPIGDTRYEAGMPSEDNANLMHLVEFKVDDNGRVSITKNIPKGSEFRKGLTASDVYIDSMIRKANDAMTKDLTNTLRAAAHLEGRTDYKVFFDDMAPALLRGVIPPASVLEELKSQGYSGTGNVNNPANWKGNSGFPSNRK